MAIIVGAAGVPHGPSMPLTARRGGPRADEINRLFAEVRERLQDMRPDAIVLFTCDHVNTFFVESIPIFSIGIPESAQGPADYAELPQYEVPIASALAKNVQVGAVGAGFDIGVSQEFRFDHAAMVPLHFLTPEMNIPILPVFVNGFFPPLPLAARCYALGANIRRTLESNDDNKRIAVIASGHFSSEIGGPRFFLPDPVWLEQVTSLLATANVSALVDAATPAQLTKAGNVAGEVLTWLTMLGMMDVQPPTFFDAKPGRSHAYGVWDCESTAVHQ